MSIYLAIYIYLSIYIYFYIHISIRGTCPEEDHGCGSAHRTGDWLGSGGGSLGGLALQDFSPKMVDFFYSCQRIWECTLW